ncbi:MAG: UDP-glucose 4-epimerase GalE [Magnetococcales bacterium]|nr:UDP-glucose 4-epimerase GalE [Magnetococcales bacterium]NGZ28876.1 UDP-glucose 4-epimerase GalE [Magnetococcales bacterium]
MNLLVTGGAGYIGSHMVKYLLQHGYGVTTLDNLSTGFREAVVGGNFVRGDLQDTQLLHHLFSHHKFDGVFHFASSCLVKESVDKPAQYYRNNVVHTHNLLDAMLSHGCPYIVFSSTAATFGESTYSPMDEYHPQQPINPYGRSKLMVEHMLADYHRAYGLKSVSLRYFNAAGADPQGNLGERHNPETHLIPLILQTASGRKEALSLFGDDYPTPDGTAIRDYIHVYDLCAAHLLALQYLKEQGGCTAFNLGNGHGFSVQEILTVANQVTGQQIKVIHHPRRPGDPAVLVADARRAHTILGWCPHYSTIETMMRHAWAWELKQSQGQ